MLENKIQKLKNDIEIISENRQELDYYDKTGDIIFDYYKLRDDKKNEFHETKNILDYFNKKKVKKEVFFKYGKYERKRV